MRIFHVVLVFIVLRGKNNCLYSQEETIKFSDVECENDQDCYDPGNFKCTICLENSKGKSYCSNQFFMWYKNQCAYRLGECDPPCPASHECKANDPTYSQTCFCNSNENYGNLCQYQTEKGNTNVRMLQRFIQKNTFVKPGVSTKIGFLITADNNDVLRSTHYLVETDLGYMENNWVVYQKNIYPGFRSRNFSFAIMFPYVLPRNMYNVTVYKLKDKLRGYPVSISLSLQPAVGGLTDVERYPIFVDYSLANLKCIPDVHLKNCGYKLKDAAIFHRNVPVDINYVVKYYADGGSVSKAIEDFSCSSEDVTFIWSWWSFSIKGLYKRKSVGEKIDQSPLRIEPFELKFGLYAINLRLKRVFDGESNENFHECFVKVQPLPLIAIIDGGDERTVKKGTSFSLSAFNSYDPNQPADKQDMYIEWTCECLTKTITNCDEFCKTSSQKLTVDEVYTPSDNLAYNAVYKFTLKVYSDLYSEEQCKDCTGISPQFDYVTITVADKSDKRMDEYYIACIENCGGTVKTNEILVLKVKEYDTPPVKHKEKKEFKWTYSKADEGVFKSVDTIKVGGLPSSMLAIKEDALEQGTNYTIKLTEADSGVTIDKYSFETLKFETAGSCSITPENGTAGRSIFNIQCSGFGKSLLFEFYDKSADDLQENVTFNGRMLGDLYEEGCKSDVRLSRGNVIAYVTNEKGLFTTIELKVELSPWDITEEIMSGIRENLTETAKLGILTRTLDYISFIPDVIPSFVDKRELLYFLLRQISKVPLTTLSDVKMSSSTLSNVLLSLNKPTCLSLTPELILDIQKVIRRQAGILRASVLNRVLSQRMASKEIREVTRSIINCLIAALKCKDKDIVNQDVDDFSFKTIFLLRQNARHTEEIIDLIKDILSYIQPPGLSPYKVSAFGDAFHVWTMVNDEENPVNRILLNDENIPISVSKTLLETYNENKIGRNLVFQVASMEENAFYWSKSDVKSKLISLSVATRREEEELRKIEYLDAPISIRVAMEKNLTNTTVVGSTIQMDPDLDPLYLDLGIAIHRIDMEPKGFLTIRFLYPQTNESLRVLVMEDFRPDYVMMCDESVIVNSSNPEYPLKRHHIHKQMFLFIGVLPGPDVSINKTVDYTFEISTMVCMMWSGGQWSSIGCSISYTTTADEAHCECTHLSIFAAAFPVPPQSIDPFGDIKLFLQVLDNPIVVVFITTLLAAYLLFLLWARYRDKADRNKGKVIVLEDNFPDDSCPYLVAVYTSARFNAGTTAHVGIKLIGKKARSRAHIFSCERRKVLRRHSDDWFMIYTGAPLGDVYGIHLWHDNSGSSPEWYCEKIIVYDIKEKTEALFIVEQWLGLQENHYPEASVLIASSQEMLHVKRLFLDNCILGFRDNHTFLSILVRHPRSDVTRVQRISILMCAIMVAMLCSIMFYKPQSEDDAVDEYHYDVGTKEIIVSVETLFITFIFTYSVFFLFRRSYKVYYVESQIKMRYRHDQLAESISQYPYFNVTGSQGKQDQSFFNTYVRYISKYLKGPPLAPVSMWGSEKKVEQRTAWHTAAWVTCILIICGSAYLVMLYGLKIGFVQSQKWLTSLTMCMGEEIFVVGPSRIILVAILLSTAFQRSTKVNIHEVNMQDLIHARPQKNKLSLEILLVNRSHPMYAPLSATTRMVMLKKVEIRKQWWALIDFTNAVCFMVVVSYVTYRLWTSQYYSFQQLQTMFVDSHSEYLGAMDLNKVNNLSIFETYLEVSFISTMFNLRWYNEEPLTELYQEPEGIRRYWAQDGLHKMIGHPLIRQVRVVPKECCNTYFAQMRKCLLRWSLSNEDKDVYGEKWAAAEYSDTTEKTSPWKYTNRETVSWFINQRFYGSSCTLYDVSGYMTTLGPSQQQVELRLLELKKNRWQDWYTRAVFLELTLYNVNEHLFSQVTILVEYFIVGSLSWNIKVISVPAIVLFGFWEMLFLFYAVYYVFRSAYAINHMGLMDYLRSVNNVCRIIVVFLAFLAIIIWCIHHRTSIKYAESFLKTIQDDYFDFDLFIRNFNYLQMILSVLLCVGIARAIMLLRGGRSMLTPYYTILVSLRVIFWLSLIFITLLLVLSNLSYLCNTYLYVTTKNLLLNRRTTTFLQPADFVNLNVQIFVIFRMVSVYLLSGVFLVCFVYFTKIAKGYKVKKSDKFNLLLFFIARLSKLCIRRVIY